MNRRVEFRLCEPTDADMERPSSSFSTKGTGGNLQEFLDSLVIKCRLLMGLNT